MKKRKNPPVTKRIVKSSKPTVSASSESIASGSDDEGDQVDEEEPEDGEEEVNPNIETTKIASDYLSQKGIKVISSDIDTDPQLKNYIELHRVRLDNKWVMRLVSDKSHVWFYDIRNFDDETQCSKGALIPVACADNIIKVIVENSSKVDYYAVGDSKSLTQTKSVVGSKDFQELTRARLDRIWFMRLVVATKTNSLFYDFRNFQDKLEFSRGAFVSVECVNTIVRTIIEHSKKVESYIVENVKK